MSVSMDSLCFSSTKYSYRFVLFFPFILAYKYNILQTIYNSFVRDGLTVIYISYYDTHFGCLLIDKVSFICIVPPWGIGMAKYYLYLYLKNP